MIAWILALLVGTLALSGPAAAGERFLAHPELAAACEAALVAATTPFAQKKLKQLDKCASAAYKCIQTVAPNDEAEEDPIDVCLEKALTKCEKATDAIAAEEQKLVDAITKGCAALDPADVIRADGVGFEVIASDCLDFGVTLTDTASVADCVVQEHECAVEQMYLMEHPRAGELFDLVGADTGACLDDLGGPGEGVGDLRTGRALTQCEAGVVKTGGTFVGSKLKNIGRCLASLFDCVQLAPHDDTCIAKAQTTCDKAFAAVGKSALVVEPAVQQSCGAIPFETLTADTGVDYDALVDEELCTEFGVFGIATVPHYATCMYRQHECAVDEILKFTTPRAEELLALIGRTLPGSFFCTPPEDF